MANGALKVHAEFVKQVQAANLDVVLELKEESHGDVHISKSGCQGFCQMGPLVTVMPAGILYTKVKPMDVEEIVQETLVNNRVVDRLLYTDAITGKHCHGPSDIPFYVRQSRTVLKSCGIIDPEDINEYIHNGGYWSAKRAYTDMTDQMVCEEILHSGLRGFIQAGFVRVNLVFCSVFTRSHIGHHDIRIAFQP